MQAHLIQALRGTGKNADRAVIAVRIVARMLHRLPGDLQHQPVLRIHQFGLAWVETEHPGVEQVDVLDDAPRLYIGRIVDERSFNAGLAQLIVREQAQ